MNILPGQRLCDWHRAGMTTFRAAVSLALWSSETDRGPVFIINFISGIDSVLNSTYIHCTNQHRTANVTHTHQDIISLLKTISF